MKIKKHKLTDDKNIEFKQTPNVSKKFPNGLPDTIILHYTAAPSARSAVNWLTNKKASASAHVVVGRDCKITQLADFNVVTWHAGKSKWNDRSGLNNYSIGIEIDNCGILKKSGKKYSYGSNGPEYSKDEILLTTHKNGGRKEAWHKYPQEQIDRVFELCQLLIKEYNIKHVLGHEDIAPRRKTDPGPAFPMDKFRKKLFGSKKSEEASSPDRGIIISETPLYSKPNNTSTILFNKIPENSEVTILSETKYFYKVSINLNGYVSKKYTDFDNSDSPHDGVVNTDDLNFRSNSNSKASILGEPLSKGTKFQLLENSGSWIMIRVEFSGYVLKESVRG